MPKKINITVLESADYIQREYSKAKGSLQKARLKTLFYIKGKRYHFQSDIAKKLGRNEKTIQKWLLKYQRDGFASFLEVKSGGLPSFN